MARQPVRRAMKDTTPNVLEPEMLRETWKITATIPEGRANDKEKMAMLVKELSRQVAKKIHEVETLQIDFKTIKKIDNLWGFERLTTLKLDNNVIVKIENIGHLTTLTVLDLSFNQITAIENLDTLVNLTDLNLSNNQITKIENMDALVNLNAVVLGNNRIGIESNALSQLMCLRQFENLQLLVLDGNPISQQHDYQKYVVSHIKKLVYLDFRLITEETRKAANERYNDELLQLVSIEREQAQRKEQMAIKEKERGVLKNAGLEGFATFFEDMFADDAEFNKIKGLEAIKEALDAYQERFVQWFTDFRAAMLSQNVKRDQEIDTFRTEVESAKDKVKHESLEIIHGFTTHKRDLYRELADILRRQEEEETEKFDKILNEDLFQAIMSLSDELMELEMYQVEQLDDAIVNFERVVSDTARDTSALIDEFFPKLVALEDAFHALALEVTTQAVEKYRRDELTQELTDDLKSLLNDKEGAKSLLDSSHDFRLTNKIDPKQGLLKERLKNKDETLINQLRAEFATRNRERVEEITQLTLHYEHEKSDVHNRMEIPPTLIS